MILFGNMVQAGTYFYHVWYAEGSISSHKFSDNGFRMKKKKKTFDYDGEFNLLLRPVAQKHT